MSADNFSVVYYSLPVKSKPQKVFCSLEKLFCFLFFHETLSEEPNPYQLTRQSEQCWKRNIKQRKSVVVTGLESRVGLFYSKNFKPRCFLQAVRKSPAQTGENTAFL